LARWAKND